MNTTGYSESSTFYSVNTEKYRQDMRFKRKQLHDDIASQQRQAFFKKIRNTQLYSKNGQAQSGSQMALNQLNSIAEVQRGLLVQPRGDSNLNLNVQPPSGNFQNMLSQSYQISFQSNQPTERIIVPQFQQEFDDIDFDSQSNQSQFQVGFSQQLEIFQNSQVRNHVYIGNVQFPQIEDQFMLSPSPAQNRLFWPSPHNSPDNNMSPPNGLNFTFFRPVQNSPNQQKFSPPQFSPPQNGNFSFGPQEISPPQINQNANNMDFSFSNQFNKILPPHINSPQQRNSPNQNNFIPQIDQNNFMPQIGQNNFIQQSILSNDKIIQNPFYVNPYLEFVEERAIRESPKHILEETKRKLEEKKWENLENNIMLGIEQKDMISPFMKHKKIPEPYPAFEVVPEEERKNHQELSVKDSAEKKKKPEHQEPLTSFKRQTKQVQEKVNPQKPKRQSLPKKDPIIKKDFPAKKVPSKKKDISNIKTENPIKKEPIKKEQISNIKKQQPPKKPSSQKAQNSRKSEPKSANKPSAPQSTSCLDLLIKQNNIMKLHKHYIIFEKMLGKGSFASVHLGISSQLKQKVAVKKMKIKRIKQMCQVEYLIELNHRNVIMLYDYLMEEKNSFCYLFLEFCDENLRQRIDRIEKQKLARHKELQLRINFAEQLIEGMNALNHKGFIHRDLKFENILVKDDVLKIGDFGLCRKLNKKLQIQSIRCGTPYTMAPEIYFHPKESYLNPTYTEKTDIFSLAVILHELIYNTHPFDYEERLLKNLNRVDVTRNDNILREVCAEAELNITWIREIINKGLKNHEERLTWEGLMDIYKNRNLGKNKRKEKSLDTNSSKKGKENNKLDNLIDVCNESFLKKSLEKTNKEENKQQKNSQKEEEKDKSNEQNTSKSIIIYKPLVEQKENSPQIKHKKSQARKGSNLSSGKKQKFDIIEEAKKVFGDPSNQKLNRSQDQLPSRNNSRIISFDEISALDSSLNKSGLEMYRIKRKENKKEKEEKKSVQVMPTDAVISMVQQTSVSQGILKNEKIGRELFKIFATIIIIWACFIVVGKLFMRK